MCRFNIIDVILVFAEATSPPGFLTCNPAAERSGAKSESEFREAKVKCIQSQPLLLFYWLTASCFLCEVPASGLLVCAVTSFD